MQTITIQGSENLISQIIAISKALAQTSNQKLIIQDSYDELVKDYEQRVREIENGTAELISLDEFKKEMNEFIKAYQ
ncbi:MAG: hypothetical protein GX282_08060 [Campylobacteraceae bacterium]|nr:hypothetical protein [Campylobacteraceae bacterium]